MEEKTIKKLGMDIFKHDFKHTLLRITTIIFFCVLVDGYLDKGINEILNFCVFAYTIIDIFLFNFYNYEKNGFVKNIILTFAMLYTISMILVILLFLEYFLYIFYSKGH